MKFYKVDEKTLKKLLEDSEKLKALEGDESFFKSDYYNECVNNYLEFVVDCNSYDELSEKLLPNFKEMGVDK